MGGPAVCCVSHSADRHRSRTRMWVPACVIYLAAMATFPVFEALQSNRNYLEQHFIQNPPEPLLHLMLGKRQGYHLHNSPGYSRSLSLQHLSKKDMEQPSGQTFMDDGDVVNKGYGTTQEDPPVGEMSRRAGRMLPYSYPLLHMMPGRKRYPGLHRHYYPILHAVPVNRRDETKRQLEALSPEWTQRFQGFQSYPANRLRAWAQGQVKGLRLKRSTADIKAPHGQLSDEYQNHYEDKIAPEQDHSMGSEVLEEPLFRAVKVEGTGGGESMTDPLFFEEDGSSGNDTSGPEQTFDRGRRHFAPLLHSIGRMGKGNVRVGRSGYTL